MKYFNWTNPNGTVVRVTCPLDSVTAVEFILPGATLGPGVVVERGAFVRETAVLGSGVHVRSGATVRGTVGENTTVQEGLYVPLGARLESRDCGLVGTGTYFGWSSIPGYLQYGCESGPMSKFDTQKKRLYLVRQHGGSGHGPHRLSARGRELYADLTRAYLTAKAFHDLGARPPKPESPKGRKKSAKSTKKKR